MTPNDFLRFRDRLRPASGFQSVQFRAIEALAGLREPARLEDHPEHSPEREMLQRRFEGPSLAERFYALLGRRGFELPGLDPTHDGVAGDVDPGPAMRELARLYLAPSRNYDLYLLAEALIEFDEMFMLWRVQHVLMAERMIGARPGTGGSEGVGYLRSTLGRKLFPPLWQVRSYMGDGGM
jgi:tryptophan 2,3-dioxygenase